MRPRDELGGPNDLTERLTTLPSATAPLGLGSALGWLAASGPALHFSDEVAA